jgi:hypothetical protein
MDNIDRAWSAVPVLLLGAVLVSVPAFSQYPAQGGGRSIGSTQRIAVGDAIKGGDMNIATGSTDFAGEWVVYDEEERELGNFTGIPHSEAGRMRAETHDASEWSIPEFQCRPHPMIAQWRASGAIRIRKDVDPVNRAVTALRITFVRGLDDRVVYLDGRPHPSQYAPHTWYGFSTGEFKGNTLVVTTTHLKEGYFDWNGNTVSDKAKVTEWWVRHGDFLTITVMHEDPVYLTEPFIQSISYKLDTHTEVEFFPCTVINENLSSRFPHHLPGKNPYLREYAEDMGIPYEAARGGAETMYPEFRAKLRNLNRAD